jgi:diadenosine tetraphosphate (Ap4A) HIT family hydrolase
MKCRFCDDEYIRTLSERIILENDLAYARYDGFPVNEGHMLIITKRHMENFFHTTEDEKKAIFDLVSMCKILLDEKYNPDGYNIGMNCGASAGQTVMHTHIHLIPRYDGDVPNPKGGVRGVIPSKQDYTKNKKL